MQFASRSVEFRLLLERHFHEAAYRAHADAWNAARLLDILAALAVPAYDAASFKTYEGKLRRQRRALFRLIDPIPGKSAEAGDGKASIPIPNHPDDAGKAAYLAALGGPYRSLDDLMDAVHALNCTMEESRRDHARR